VKWWVKVAGTGEAAYTQERWDERRARLRIDGSGVSLFPRRPRIERGDRLVVYASGSAAVYGEGRFVAIEEVISDEPEPSGHERWPWRLDTRLVAAVDELAVAPALREIGVSRSRFDSTRTFAFPTSRGMRRCVCSSGRRDCFTTASTGSGPV
jgi:hypothetical protein